VAGGCLLRAGGILMNSKNNRVNHDFQIAYFLAGSCHTPDGAYALLCDLREDRRNALAHSESTLLRQQAKRIRAERLMLSSDEVDRLEGEADIAELDAHAETQRLCIVAGQAELEFIEKCMGRLEPLRKFKHLPDPVAHEAAQHDEWKLELLHRAENQMLTTGTIDPEHFNTMRMHPAFKSELLPAVDAMGRLLMEQGGREALLERVSTKSFELPLLELAS